MPLRAPAGAKAKKKAAEKERLKEEERLREEERLKEEARLAAEAAEKARIDAEIQAQLASPGGQLRDLLKWLNAIPLTRNCYKRIDRELSDGVIVAQTIAHYCPEICDARRFFAWYSSDNKQLNWDSLNRTVFPELGFQLTPAVIKNLVQPFGCRKYEQGCFQEPMIYQVLRQIRDGIARINPAVYEYRTHPDFFNPEITPCEKPVKSKVFKRKPRVDDDRPPFSKLEIEIANGKFDEEDKKNEELKKNQNREADSHNCGVHENDDWVKFYGTGGEIVFPNEEASTWFTPQRCWTCN